MVSEAEIQEALRGLYNRVGTQKKLAELAGITQSTINAYLSGKAKIENMPVGVFVKLFRNMKIDYFGEMTGNSVDDSIKKQLLHIYDNLDIDNKVKLLSMASANFGDKIREETKK